MANVLGERGFFWWLNEPNGRTNSKETSVPGLLTVSEEGHVALDLEGAMWFAEPSFPVSLGESRRLPSDKRITGLLGTYSSDGHVLLEGIERTDFSLEEQKPARQTYTAERCFKGDSPFAAHFDSRGFQQLRVELLGLEEWLKLESIHVQERWISEDEREAQIKYKDQRFSYQHEGGSVSIECLTYGLPILRLSGAPDRELHVRQAAFLSYSPHEESNADSLLYEFNRIEELFALLLGSYFRLDWPTLVQRDGDSESWSHVYYSRGQPPDEKVNWWLTWTSFHSLQPSFGKLLGAWRAQAERFDAGYYLYLAAMRNPLPYPEHEFVNLIWGIESLHRKKLMGSEETEQARRQSEMKKEVLSRFSEPADRHRLKWLKRKLKYADDPMLSERILDVFGRLPLPLDMCALRKFAERCAKRRNDISHVGGPREDESYADFIGEVRELRDALRFLYHALLLHEIGIDTEILLDSMTKGIVANMRILPALARVGIELSMSEKADTEPQGQ